MTFSKIRIYFKVQSRKIEKRGEKVFPNLEAEMARNKVTQVKLAEILGITPTTLSFKMNIFPYEIFGGTEPDIIQ